MQTSIPTSIETSLLQHLNEAQTRAVLQTEGPSLIVAGPGSGKTRVITYRMAHMIKNLGHNPRQIIAVTFTNRAAREMLNRTIDLVGETGNIPDIRTFHSLCAKILRADGDRIRLHPRFTIYDDDDQTGVIRHCLRQLGLKDERPGDWLERISKAKSKLLNPSQAAQAVANEDSALMLQKIYQAYQDDLTRARAVDFDDLIMLTVTMLRNSREGRRKYQQNHTHLMVDEFQDTNHAQYELCRLLSDEHRNICVVGDPDQSIYGWRSAEPENINRFQEDFPNCVTTALGENYRSTKNIVTASHSLIRRNPRPIDNLLYTNNHRGPELSYELFYDEQDEATAIVDEINLLSTEREYSPGDCAVLYRTNAASKPIEEACLHSAMKYRIIGGTSFYRRKEVRDTMAYLKLLVNRYDRIAFGRVINTPPRGLGAKSLASVNDWAHQLGIPVYDALEQIANGLGQPPKFSKRAVASVRSFIVTMDLMREAAQELPCDQLLQYLLRETGMDQLITESSDTTNDRWANIQTLISTAARNHTGPAVNNLEEFLENAALLAQDENEEHDADALTLITLHKSKGTEYPVIFMIGLEEGTLPHKRSLSTPREIQEERRLCYVGITRAKERLYLSRTRRTRSYRNYEEDSTGPLTTESRFLEEMLDISTEEDRP